MNRWLGAAISAAAIGACSQAEVVNRGTEVFRNGDVAGVLRGGNMREVSGMVASLTHPGHYWLHNDSGAEAELILIDSTGVEKARVQVEGATHRDWEDISRRGDTLLIADMGDNNARWDTIFVYSVIEPKTIANQTVRVLETFPMRFPDGPRDAESLMVDPLSGNWFIVSKREEKSRVYGYRKPQQPGVLATLERMPGELPFRLAVGADISADGREILIKTYDSVYLWQRSDSEAVSTALARAPMKQPYVPERQGEAIAFSLSGDSYFTASEIELDDPQLLIRYRRRPDKD